MNSTTWKNGISKTVGTCLLAISVVSTSLANPTGTYHNAIQLAEARNYQQAFDEVHKVNRADRKNLDAWRLRIWLATMNGNDAIALETIEWLANRMPPQTASRTVQERADGLAEFLGEITGFMVNKNDNSPAVGSYTQRVVESRLEGTQLVAFKQGFARVDAGFNRLKARIDQEKATAIHIEQRRRESQLAVLNRERDTVFAEFEKLESLRAADRERSSNERNVHAATRSRARASSHAYHAQRGGHLFFPRGYGHRRHPVITGRELHVTRVPFVSTNHLHHGGYRRHATSLTGLHDRHYRDVNQREADYDQYLQLRTKKLHRQLNRIDREEKGLLRDDNDGMSANVVKQLKSLNSLATFVKLPVKSL